MLDVLITSKTRLKLLLKFFLNGDNKSYLRGLESEFSESSNAIRVELNRFEDAGLLVSSTEGNKKLYQANKTHPIFKDIHNLLIKFVGIDEIIDKVLHRIGDLQYAYVTGDFALGIDSSIIDLLLVGDQLDRKYIAGLVEKAEGFVQKKIRLLILDQQTLEPFLQKNRSLLIWSYKDQKE